MHVAQVRLLVLVTLATAMFVALPAQAEQQPIETDNELLRQGLELYDQLEYERAVEVLSAALLQPGNSAEEQALIYQTLGALYVFLGRQREAELALERLLCVNPDFTFDEYASPRLTSVFDRVRQRWLEQGQPCPEQGTTPEAAPSPVHLDHESPESTHSGSSIDIRVEVEDPELQVAAVTLHYRAAGEEQYEDAPTTMVSPGVFEATIPGDVVQPPAAEYFIEATGDDGQPLATLGTARAPLRVPVSPEEHRSIARRWWFWTIVGVAVVGTGLGLGLGLGLRDQTTPPTEATLTVQICDGENPGVCFTQ